MIMKNEDIIILAEDDLGHVELIKKYLKRAGLSNEVLHFKDGQETLDFLLKKGDGPHIQDNKKYILLLDIRMPKIDGIEVLSQVKKRTELKTIPVLMLTTSDDPREIQKCHELGCNNYITKSSDYQTFEDNILRLGLFLPKMEVPSHKA
jgi:CheY-like chemotaxis protein